MARWKKSKRRPTKKPASRPLSPDALADANAALDVLQVALRGQADSRRFAKLLRHGLAGAAASFAAKQKSDADA
jgi:hypothetical protein